MEGRVRGRRRCTGQHRAVLQPQVPAAESAAAERRHGAFRAAFAGPPALNRGVAFGDFDRDGRVDAVVTRLNEPPVLLRNIMGAGNHWIALDLIGARSNRDGIGARVAVRSGGVMQVNRVATSTGYACASESAVHFGLGRSTRADSIEIEWPSGSRQVLANVPADSYMTVRERQP